MKTKFSKKEIADSRAKALQQVIEFLSVLDIENQFNNRNAGHWSKEKFLVTWSANYHGMAAEERLDLCDPFYAMYSRHKCIRVTVGLFHEKQLAGYDSIHRGLIEVGLVLCVGNDAKKDFFEKYAVPYNEMIKSKQAA